jgi:hypothetical protein
MWSAACTQCRQRISLDVAHCPYCGAFQKLNGRQIVLRVIRKAAYGAVTGGFVGTVCLALVAVVLAVGGNGFSLFTKTLSVLVPLGALCGSIVGGMCKAIYEANRWEWT